MSVFELAESLYLLPSPGGVFYAVSENHQDPQRIFLTNLLREPETPVLTAENLTRLFESDDLEFCMSQLFQAQTMSLVEGVEAPQGVITNNIGTTLRRLLAELSTQGKAVVVDHVGSPLARAGLETEDVEVLSALSADLVALQKRHANRLAGTLSLFSQGWGAVDAFGSSKVAMWPLFIGNASFSLVVVGEPRLNQAAFTSLVWMLMHRYGNS